MERKFAPGAVVDDQALGARQIRVVASTPTPDRAGDVMVPRGCMADAYFANPIVLADHDPTKPIGTAKLDIADDHVGALIDFAPAGASAKADEYCALAKAGVLKTVSIGFAPIEFEPIKGAGYRYAKWELMEISLVAVPANPEALVVNRSAQSAVAKAEAAWKCGASRNLPLGPDEAWDGAAAEKSVFDHCGFDGDKPDAAFARKAFLAYDSANPNEKGSYKEPFAKIVDGRLTAMPAGIRAAASRLPQADMAEDVRSKGRAVVDYYEAKMKAAPAPVVKGFVIKALWDVASLAGLLMRLGWEHSQAVEEALREGDNSKVPAMLAEALQKLAAAFLAMSAEEVSELLAGKDIEMPLIDEGGVVIELATAPKAKVWSAVCAKAGAVLSAANRAHLDAIRKCLDGIAAAHVKAADAKDEMHDHLEEMRGHIEEATKAARALGKRKPKPKPVDAESGDEEDGDSSTDDADPESGGADVELAAAARRKREIEIMELAAR
jgi:HK97 family phage prohead protease